MTNINHNNIINACDTLCRKCTRVGEAVHGSAYWADKLIRFFDAEKACQSVVLPVFINAPVMSDGEATIDRDGNLTIRTI